MNGPTQCPACRSLRTHITKGEFKTRGFQAFGNRLCYDCGTAWRPLCPRWAAILSVSVGGLLLGIILAVAGGALFSQTVRNDVQDALVNKGLLLFGFITVTGFWAFWYGVAVLRGRAGQLEILGKTIAATPAAENSEPENNSLSEGVCIRCQRPVPPGSVYCAGCGPS
jgi:F0F1-type ATP synthase membrane subunit c/vacuolar-type H+-ATPase subunit K